MLELVSYQLITVKWKVLEFLCILTSDALKSGYSHKSWKKVMLLFWIFLLILLPLNWDIPFKTFIKDAVYKLVGFKDAGYQIQ